MLNRFMSSNPEVQRMVEEKAQQVSNEIMSAYRGNSALQEMRVDYSELTGSYEKFSHKVPEIWKYLCEILGEDFVHLNPPEIELSENEDAYMEFGGAVADFRVKRVVVTPFGYGLVRNRISGDNTWHDIAGHEMGHFATIRKLHRGQRQIVVNLTPENEDKLKFYEALKEALAYSAEERVINRFTDERGKDVVDRRIEAAKWYNEQIGLQTGVELIEQAENIWRTNLKGVSHGVMRNYVKSIDVSKLFG